MEDPFLALLYHEHQHAEAIPPPARICEAVQQVLPLLFPELSDRRYTSLRELSIQYEAFRFNLHGILSLMADRLPHAPEQLESKFMEQLPVIRNLLIEDAQTIADEDPAASSRAEVVRTYPGFLAIAVYRIAHALYKLAVPLIPRILTEHAHSKTGIDIHPGAEIGRNFFIDHGTGVVIGQTAEIGNHVKIYQGVTLGAMRLSKKMHNTKRHPSIGDHVIIYSGATILGGDTHIGHHSIIGGNVWLTQSVPPNSRLYHQAQIKHLQAEKPRQMTEERPLR
ncbi:MAG: serine O-acetyltransferase EpsC [Bacteroidota bacterium]